MMVELSFMFIIILGRWILPKGNISHNALSQLLLVYLSLASDILDLLTLFNEKEIYLSSIMVHIVLTVFSVCMLQFALNLTATRGRSFHVEFDDVDLDVDRPVVTPLPSTSKPLSMHRRFLARLMSNSFSSSTARPLTGNEIIKASVRATSDTTSPIIAQPPDTIFENLNTNDDYEMKVNSTVLRTCICYTSFKFDIHCS
jgi:hypothetical protein